MQITKFSDIALRAMMAVALDPDRLFSIRELSNRFRVSNNHMVKVVHSLVGSGYLRSVRGRNGGIKIARLPSDITLGEIVRSTETTTRIIDCKTADCPLFPECNLQGILNEANDAFYASLDQYFLSDVASSNGELEKVINASV